VLRVVALVILVALAGCGADADEPDEGTAPRPPLRVLVAGDSLTEGYYASTPDRGFAPLVVDALRRAGGPEVTPVVVGVSGARAFRVAARVEETTAGARPFDVAVLEVGANDVGKSSLREWTDGYRRLLAAVSATSPDAEVVCLGPWHAPRPARAYESVLRRLCADHVYLPLSDLFAADGLRGPEGAPTALGPRDAFHPNDRGHAAIADRVAAAVAGELRDRSG
jgi:acyl-CoA thioesterase-1